MEKTFQVSIPAQTRTLLPKAGGKADVTYTVTNTKPNPARVRICLVSKNFAKSEWFQVCGDAERNIISGESQQFKIQIAIPTDTPSGTYDFRVDAINTANPEEDFVEGEVVTINWTTESVSSKRQVNWFIPAVVSTIVIVAFAATIPFMNREVIVPDVVGDAFTERRAREVLNAAGLRCVVDEIAVPRRALDRIVATAPTAGQKATKGSTVKIMRLYEISTPGLTGTKFDRDSLKEFPEFDVVVKNKEQYDDSQVGIVESQSPAPGTPMTCNGSKHQLTLHVLSIPSMVRVPDVLGYSKDSAQHELERLGFKVSVVDEYPVVKKGLAPEPRFMQVVGVSTNNKQRFLYRNPAFAEADPSPLPFRSDVTIHLKTIYDCKLTIDELHFRAARWADASIPYAYLSFDYTAEIYCDGQKFIASGTVEDVDDEDHLQKLDIQTLTIRNKVLATEFDCRIVVTLKNIAYRFNKTEQRRRVAEEVRLTGTAAMSSYPWQTDAHYQTGNIKEDRENAMSFWQRHIKTDSSLTFTATLKKEATELPPIR